MRIKINDKIYRLKEIESGVDSLMELVEEPQYKDGDFVVGIGCIFILHKQIDEDSAKYHVLYANTTNGMLLYDKTYSKLGGKNKLRLATEAEKQELLDALEKEGKRWNAEKLCVEDIPTELKKGDLAIFWDSNKESAMIGKYDYLTRTNPFMHKDKVGNIWKNAIKFESKEQYERLTKGEI